MLLFQFMLMLQGLTTVPLIQAGACICMPVFMYTCKLTCRPSSQPSRRTWFPAEDVGGAATAPAPQGFARASIDASDNLLL